MIEETNFSDVLERLFQRLAPPCPDPSALANPSGSGKILVVRDGYSVHQLSGAMRTVRQHRFDDVASFAEWLACHATADKSTEIGVEKDAIRALLDPTDRVDHDVVSCDLVRHPFCERWQGAMKAVALGQRDLHFLLRAQQSTIVDPVADQLLEQVARLSIAAKGDFTAEIDPTGLVRVSGGNEKVDVSAKLPPAISVYCPIYDGIFSEHSELISYSFTLLLQSSLVENSAGRKELRFALVSPDFVLAEHAARRDVVSYLRRLLPHEFLVGMGFMRTATTPSITGEI